MRIKPRDLLIKEREYLIIESIINDKAYIVERDYNRISI